MTRAEAERIWVRVEDGGLAPRVASPMFGVMLSAAMRIDDRGSRNGPAVESSQMVAGISIIEQGGPVAIDLANDGDMMPAKYGGHAGCWHGAWECQPIGRQP